MIIKHDMISMNAARNAKGVNRKQQKSIEKMSSGYRINRAGDDAASLAISEKMRGQIRGLNQASINVETGISLVQTADGAMQEVNHILNRMRTLGVQAANDTNTDDDREQLQKEIVQLKHEINRIGKETEFNTIKVLQGKGGLIEDVWIPDGEQKIEHIVEFKTLVNFEDTDKFDDNIIDTQARIKKAYPNFNSNLIRCSKTIDFSNITESNKHLLLGENKAGGIGFAFGCSANCEQNFSFEFVESVDSAKADKKYADITNQYGVLDTNPDHNIMNNNKGGSKKFLVAVDKFTSGKELAQNIAAYVEKMNGINNKEGSSNVNVQQVGHANYLFASDGKIIIGGIDTSATNSTSRKYELFHSDSLKEIKEEIKIEVPGHWITIYPERVQMRIQTGSNAGQEINIQLPQIDEQSLEITEVDVSTHKKAVDSLEMVDGAVEYVNGERTRMGAYQNRMEHAVLSLDNTAENLQAAESRIRDLDMASHMVEVSKNNILQQAGTAVLSNGTEIVRSTLQLLS